MIARRRRLRSVRRTREGRAEGQTLDPAQASGGVTRSAGCLRHRKAEGGRGLRAALAGHGAGGETGERLRVLRIVGDDGRVGIRLAEVQQLQRLRRLLDPVVA